jgi:hypothetical protein
MNFFNLPTEIRLEIYSELLVLSEPIVFVADHGPSSPPLFRAERDGLSPALLRTNRRVHHEASPLLYSNNRFQFPEISTYSVHIAPFLNQIGSQTSYIRHICIPFPIFDYPKIGEAWLNMAHIKNLELIRDACTNIRILELLISPCYTNYELIQSRIAAAGMDLFDTHLKTIPSLKEIIVDFEVYPEDDPGDDLTEKMHGYGWTVSVTRLPKKRWISMDDRVEFDNEEDCLAYDNEQFLIEERIRQREADEQWVEEYYRRRHDPYWKNDSDYD